MLSHAPLSGRSWEMGTSLEGGGMQGSRGATVKSWEGPCRASSYSHLLRAVLLSGRKDRQLLSTVGHAVHKPGFSIVYLEGGSPKTSCPLTPPKCPTRKDSLSFPLESQRVNLKPLAKSLRCGWRRCGPGRTVPALAWPGCRCSIGLGCTSSVGTVGRLPLHGDSSLSLFLMKKINCLCLSLLFVLFSVISIC